MKTLSKKRILASKTVDKSNNFVQKSTLIDQGESLKLLQNKTLGLKYDEVIANRNEYGKNKVDHQRFVVIKKIGKVLISPFNLILFFLLGFGLLDYFWFKAIADDQAWDDVIKNIIIGSMIVIGITLTLFQDIRSWYSTTKLQAMIEVKASVYRYDPQHPLDLATLNIDQVARNASELPIEELVPGDIIFLSSGDMVPADVHILMSTDLFTNESTLTGESLPVEKHAYRGKLVANDKLPEESVALMGSSVVSGSAVALVVHTGRKTFLGSVANALTRAKSHTSFDRGIKKVTYVLIGFMLVIAPTIFLIRTSFGESAWQAATILEALKWTLTVAVALTPEMLPMVVTANLARGAIKMSKNKVIVKNLNVMQSLGAMDILCTDKTGTLTEDEIELIKYLDLKGQTSEEILKYGYLNSYHQTGLKNNIDKTIIAHTMKDFSHISETFYQKVDEIPFDFARRRMSVVVKEGEKNNLLITKGAVEEILKISKKALVGNQIVPMTKELSKNVLNLSQKMNSEGLRVIAIAVKNFETSKSAYKVEDEDEMILMGYLGFHDIPKASAIKAITSLKNRGVDVKILTGDNEIVTKAICKQVGLEIDEPLLGSDIDQMDDVKLQRIALKTTIFAKVNPLQKARIVSVLKTGTNKTIGFLGDGINDAVALKTADVGISVDSATDIAKEASDIIMLEKSLTVLEDGVMGGRKTFMNILKYIKTTFASNIGNALSMLIAVLWFTSYQLPNEKGGMSMLEPMIGLQILVQNLLYDVSQLATPWDNVDSELIEKPREWDARSFVPFAIWNGPISSIFDVTTFLLMGYYFGVFDVLGSSSVATPEQKEQAAALFHTGWFIVGATTQIMIAHLVRTPKVPFFQSSASKQVYATTGILMFIAIILPSIPGISGWLSFETLQPSYYGFLALFLALYFMTNQGVKVLYKKIYKRWL